MKRRIKILWNFSAFFFYWFRHWINTTALDVLPLYWFPFFGWLKWNNLIPHQRHDDGIFVKTRDDSHIIGTIFQFIFFYCCQKCYCEKKVVNHISREHARARAGNGIIEYVMATIIAWMIGINNDHIFLSPPTWIWVTRCKKEEEEKKLDRKRNERLGISSLSDIIGLRKILYSNEGTERIYIFPTWSCRSK